MPRERRPSDEDDRFEDSGEECPVCHQEFSHGVCPIRSADCPYLEQALDEEDDVADDEE